MAASADPFDYDDMRRGLSQRVAAERQLRTYAQKVAAQTQALRVAVADKKMTEAQYGAKMEAMRQIVAAETQRITFGVSEPGARDSYLKKYGCTAWTAEAIKVIQSLRVPFVEIGAGSGHWQRALASAGVDVLSFDNGSTDAPLVGHTVGQVYFGDETEIKKHPRRALLLVYPPPGPMATKCLDLYAGDVLVYVGEGRGGVNADAPFFDALSRGWEVRRVVELDPFPQCFERMFVLTRRRPAGSDEAKANQ